MDVDLTIRYSDDRLCEVVVCRPHDETPLYRIVARRSHLGDSIGEAMREAHRLEGLGRIGAIEPGEVVNVKRRRHWLRLCFDELWCLFSRSA